MLELKQIVVKVINQWQPTLRARRANAHHFKRLLRPNWYVAFSCWQISIFDVSIIFVRPTFHVELKKYSRIHGIPMLETGILCFTGWCRDTIQVRWEKFVALWQICQGRYILNFIRISQVLQKTKTFWVGKYSLNSIFPYYFGLAYVLSGTVLKFSQNTTFKFCKVVWQHYSGEVRNITITWLQISSGI